MEKFVNIIYPCRVCGLDQKEPVWDGDIPEYDICLCCGCESGIHDEDLETVYASRKKWVDGGMKWQDSYRDPPENWNPIEQMKNIPPEWQ